MILKMTFPAPEDKPGNGSISRKQETAESIRHLKKIPCPRHSALRTAAHTTSPGWWCFALQLPGMTRRSCQSPPFPLKVISVNNGSDTAAVTPPDGMIDDELMRRTYRAMLTARLLENKLSSLYKAGKIVGGVHLGTGQEALSASLGIMLEKGRDVFAPIIRDQAGRTAFGEDMLDCTRTYLGSVEGPMRGRDGNIHRGRPREGLLPMISHLGSAVSLVAGALMARRFQGKMDGIVGATCIGDGATSTGAFHEGLNLAAVEKLPLVIVIADNKFAYSTPNTHQFACKSLVDRAAGYGVDGIEIDGTDLRECLRGLKQAVSRARHGKGPQLVVANLLRLCGHGEHDDASYVPTALRDSPLGRDCLAVAEEQLQEKNILSADDISQWRTEITATVQQAVATAQRENSPDPYQTDWSATSSPGMQ